MSERDTPYQAEWTETLRHRPDPNRVDGLQVPTLGYVEAQPPAAAGLPTGTATREMRRVRAVAETSPPPGEEPSYYDISMLKKPVWKWHIAGYFYLGGMSAGAYLVARAADRAGGDEHRDVAEVGTWIALATVIPCPPLLIADLGDPKRFHHMLRVFKPSTPMSLGTWTLVGYSGMVGAAAVRELLRSRGESPEEERGALGKAVRTWLDLHDLAGIPLAITVAGYTGILLSCTSNPLWCKNSWLGPLFSASALSTGAEAISLTLDAVRPRRALPRTQRLLQRFDTAAHAVEGVATAGLTRSAGERAQPLRKGSMRKVHKFAIGALVASEVLKVLPVSDRFRKPVRMLAAATGLAAGFAMRWSLVYGGREAAADPHLARLVGRPGAAPQQDGRRPSAGSDRTVRSQQPLAGPIR